MTSLPASLSAPSLEVRAPSDRALLALLTVFCAATAALGRFCYLLRPFDNDAAIFIYMGRMVTVGDRLCHDLIDNKFPTVGLMTSIVYRALGTCWPAYIALQAALSLLTAISLGRTAARAVGSNARLPTTLFALLFLNLTTAVFGGFQLETMQVLFTSLAAGAGIEWLRTRHPGDAFTAGLCAGCGALLKPTAVGVLIALFVTATIFKRDREGATARRSRKDNENAVESNSYLRVFLRAFVPSWSHFILILGTTIPALAALIYLHAADLLRDMPALVHQISTYAHESVFDVVELIKPLTALLLLGFPILIRGRIGRRLSDPNARRPTACLVSFLLIWLTIETTGVILQRRMYAYHFLPMVPPAALLFGTLPRLNRPGLLAASLLPIAFLSIFQAADLIATTRPGAARLPLSDYLAARAKPGDAVWMDAWPRVILETGLRPGARLPFTFLFTNYDSAGLDYSAGMLADFERIKPAYIVLPTPLDQRMQYQIDFIPELNRRPIRRQSYITGWHRIQQYTQEHYDLETMIGNDAVYHRGGS